MNKNLLSLAAVAALAAAALPAQAANVYNTDGNSFNILGRVKVDINNNKANNDHRMDGTARLGASGVTKVNDNVNVFGYVMWDLSAQDEDEVKDRIKIRYGYVGVDFKDFGKLTFGRLEDAFYRTTKVTDMFYNWGKRGVTYWGFTKNDYGGRQDGQAVYELKAGGLNFLASYRFKDESDNLSYGVGTSVGYSFDIGDDPLGFWLGYNHYEGRDGQWDLAKGLYLGADKEEVAGSIYYGTRGAPGIYGALVYNYGKLENTYKGSGVNAALSYTTPGQAFTIYGSYAYIWNHDKDLTWKSASHNRRKALSHFFNISVDYNITRNAVIYVEGEHRQKAVFNKFNDNLLKLGFIYNF
ncbi:MAG: porin [Succinivibrionaceae bacterium]|nr:porin [Succinivibrionaceae bacterium]